MLTHHAAYIVYKLHTDDKDIKEMRLRQELGEERAEQLDNIIRLFGKDYGCDFKELQKQKFYYQNINFFQKVGIE